MPYTNTWESDGLYRKFTGVVSGEEILESNFELHEHSNFQKINYIINDFTEMSGHTIEIAHTKAYAVSDDVISDSKGRLKIALIAIQEEHIALANIYCEQMEDKRFECGIFKRIEDARKWVSNDS